MKQVVSQFLDISTSVGSGRTYPTFFFAKKAQSSDFYDVYTLIHNVPLSASPVLWFVTLAPTA